MTLERIEHKVFASEAPLDEMGQFGSALATTKFNTKDVAEIQALPAYTKGWGSAIISENNYPPMEEMNGVLNVMSYHTGYLYQEGVPVYSPAQTYSATSWVKTITGEKIYRSKQDENRGNDLEDSAWWEELKLGGGGLEIGDIGIAPLGIDETKGKRRYLNGQLIIQEQYVQFTNKVKSAVALYPSLACTESEWQATATMTVGGQVGKFVIDDEQGTIRLPKIIMPIQGLTDLSKLAEIVEAGLPSHTHSLTLPRVWGNGTNANYGTAWGGDDIRRDSLTATTTGASNPIYGNSNTVQQEQIQYPYFIQVATGAETEDNIINEIELNNPFFYGMSQYFESEPNNISWLKSAGQWNAKAVYSDYYDWLLKIYNGVEVVEGVSVKLSTEEYTDYDFVLNTAEETFRLPLLDGSESLLSDRYEDLTLLSSGSNYTAPANGWFYIAKVAGADYKYLQFRNLTTGAFIGDTASGSQQTFFITCQANHNDKVNLSYDATGATSMFRFIYAQGNGSLYFYVGETVQNANLINAGRIEEKVADLIPDNSSLIASYAMPSDRYIDLTLGASDTEYTAPANGWFALAKQANATNQRLALYNRGQQSGADYKFGFNIYSSSSGQSPYVFVPAKAGDKIVASYTVGGNTHFFRFIYAEGEQ